MVFCIEIWRRAMEQAGFVESDIVQWYDSGRLEEEHSSAVI